MMKIILTLLIASTVIAVESQTVNRGTYTYEFRSGNRRINDHNSKVSINQKFYNGNGKTDRPLQKRPTGVPPYAVLMEPLVHYSQPDPLYVQEKQNITSVQYETRNDLIKKSYANNESKNRQDSQGPVAEAAEAVAPLDAETSATNTKWETSASNAKWISADQIIHVKPYRPKPKPRPTPPPEAPEPIIEIIIKESNISLPAPPPPPPPPPKKKEPVHVFFVKYTKDPNAGYGEEKLIYEPPIPAVTPPTNIEDPNEELQHQQNQYDEEAPYPDSVTYEPPPSTTLKAIIKPESEVYHGSGGLQITFGGPESHEDNAGYPSTHHGDYHQQSASHHSVSYPQKSSGISRASTDSQHTKRNPEPFNSVTQNPSPNFQSSTRPTNSPFVSSQEFQRPTSLPTYQQAPQFPAQTFQKSLQAFSNPRPTQTYSTLPQNLLQNAPGHHHFGSSRTPVQSTAQSAQQYHTINDHHLRQNFQSNVRPTQQYHTINHQTLQPNNYRTLPTSVNRFPQPTSVTPSSPFAQRTQQRPFENRPQVNFLEQNRQQPTQFSNFQQHQLQQFGQFQSQQELNIPIRQQPNQQYRQQQHVQQSQPQPQHHKQQQLQQQQPQHHQQPLQQQQPQHHQQQLQQQQKPQSHQHQLQQQQPQHHQLQQIQQQPQHHQSLQQHSQQQNYNADSAPEIIKSISADISELAKAQKTSFPAQKPAFPASPPPQVFHHHKTSFVPTSPIIKFSTPRPQFQTSKSVNTYKPTTVTKKYTQTTQPPIEYVTEDPKKLEEERRKKEERRKQNVAALPKEVPDDLREQLLSSGILGNADIQILDYDKIGDIPIENLPPEALANFRQVAVGSAPVPSVIRPDVGDSVPSASENFEVTTGPGSNGNSKTASDLMEMKVVRFNPNSKEGASIASNYMREGATQLDPVVLNDSKYNRYLPLKVAGAQFPVPDVPELRGRNVTSVVVLAPVDYEFLQRKENYEDSISRSAGPVLEVQGVHFIAGDTLKTLVKVPSSENYKRWLEKENSTSADKQSVVLLVLEPLSNNAMKDIYMYDISTQRVSKLKGELSSTFVEVAECNSQNEDLEEISDSPSAPGGDFTITDTSGLAPSVRRVQRKIKPAPNQAPSGPR